MLEKLKDQVSEMLEENPDCRNSDITLMIKIWERYYPQRIIDGKIRLSDLYELPREDNIKRIRAKLQEEALKRIDEGKTNGDEVYFLPTSEAVAKKRQINEVIWQKALNYFRRPAPTQTTVLPRPVGLIGFTPIGDNNFVVDGARGKQYTVAFDEYGSWQCTCEAFRYASRANKRECKHIKAIKQHFDRLEKEKIAKTQSNLF